MPLLTKAELAVRTARPDAVGAGTLEPPVREAPAAPVRQFRMYHPDDPSGRMNVTFQWEGVLVEVKAGAATVPAATADGLEAHGWRRGSEIKMEEWQ